MLDGYLVTLSSNRHTTSIKTLLVDIALLLFASALFKPKHSHVSRKIKTFWKTITSSLGLLLSVILQSSTTQKLHGGLTKTLLASTKNDVKSFFLFRNPLVKIFSFHNFTWNFSRAPVFSLNLSNPSKFSTPQNV